MKTLKFVEHLIPLVLSGEKTSTWRMFDDKNLSVGDDLSLINKTTLQEFATAKIISVLEKPLKEISPSDFDNGHERFENFEAMLDSYRSYYRNTVTENTPLKIIQFKLLKSVGDMHIPDHPLFESLKKLAFPKGEYAVFGSGPMWVRGIRESNDIDVIVRKATWELAKTNDNGKIGIKEEIGLEYISFSDGNIEVYRDWHPGEWDIDALIDTAEIIDGIPFVRLEHVINWKKQKGREKDIRDIALIESYQKQQNAL